MKENIKKLNELLSNLEVYNVKLQNYHWNVTGKGFFTTHEKLEEYYEEARIQIDEIAEHILAMGYQPLGTMKSFLESSEIKEAQNDKIKTLDIVEKVKEDIEILMKKVIQIKQNAEKDLDYGTSSLMDEYIKSYAKKLWMLKECEK